MRITKDEVETRAIVAQFPGFEMERSACARYQRAMFDLKFNEVKVGFGLTCGEIKQVLTVIGNITFAQQMQQNSEEEVPETAEEVTTIESESEVVETTCRELIAA